MNEQLIEYLEGLDEDVYIEKTFDEDGHLQWHCWIDRVRGVGIAAPSGTNNDLFTAMKTAIMEYQAK